MTAMLRHIRLLYLIMLPLIAGCANEWPISGTSAKDSGEDRSIEFAFLWPDNFETRAFDVDTDRKKHFNAKDMIHILGVFNTKSLQEDGTYKTGKVRRYGAMEYNEQTNSWNEVKGNELRWPSTATSGTFQAYYISGSNGVLTNTSADTCLLSNITPMTDPLSATSQPDVKYGSAVGLEFSHLCAHLTLEDLEPMVAEQYWFYTDGPIDPETKEPRTFNNAFRISLGKSAEPETLGQPTLNFEFCQQADTKYNLRYYISAKAKEQIINDNGKETVITKAGYFLEPGYYETFSLCYPATAPNIHNYLKYDYKAIPDHAGGVEIENTPPDLKANTTYTLTITKSPGVTIVNPPSAEGWHDEEEYYDVDVEEFLRAVYDKKAYENNNSVLILEATPNGTKLLHNVDFKNYKYAQLYDKSFYPNVMQDVVFDGDYHYIRNLADPLFRYNYGTIKNVGINDIKIEETSYEAKGDDTEKSNKDMSRYGALCMWNRGNAIIDNVRINNVNMTIKVRSDITAGDNDSETHNIGCVVGSNTGKINNVALSGNFILNVTGDSDNNAVNASVLIGGIAGQNAAEGEIYDVSPLEGTPSIKITNTCKGPIGSYSVGGIVGESSGKITGVRLSSVVIDGSGSSGVTSYMGGIVGKAEVSSSLVSTASVNSCIVSGSVKAGTTAKNGDLTSASYIGGIAGVVQNTPVLDSRASVSVYGSTSTSENVIYATGGAFGRIREGAEYPFKNLIAYGSALTKPSGSATATNYIGNFAGIVPQGHTWQDYAGMNIIVRKFTGCEDIGGSTN